MADRQGPAGQTEVIERILVDMVKEYQDLNPSFVEEHTGTPDAVTFADSVKRNRPCVFRGLGFQAQVPAMDRWNLDYLVSVMGDSSLRIAATPAGNADAIVDDVFVEPEYREMTMRGFLDAIVSPEPGLGDVLYLQSQNGNLGDELARLAPDATGGFSFAEAVFGQPPDATNIWIGDDRSVTSLHKDPYENMYLVVHGTKTFDLLPPTEFYCLHEHLFRCGSYRKNEDGRWTVTHTGTTTPWIPVDPTSPDIEAFPRFKHARPMSVSLQRGDVLYLPALWFHKVSQTASRNTEAPLAVAINWWYDLAYDSPIWTLSQLVRKMTLALDGRSDADMDTHPS